MKNLNLTGEHLAGSPQENNPTYGKAVFLRLMHDKGGIRLQSGEYDLNDIVEAINAGYNWYTGEVLKN